MAYGYQVTPSEPSPDDTYKPVERGVRNRESNKDESASATTGLLPAKSFSSKDSVRTGRLLYIGAVITALIVAGFSVLASQIHRFEPNIEWIGVSTPVSCDLVTEDARSVENAFAINLRNSKQLSFPQAKAIDVVWQLLVGAGGRFVMAWLSYRAFLDGLTRIMEYSAVPYNLHASMVFSAPSLLALKHAVKTLFTIRGSRGKFFLLWLVISSVYVLAFPSLISATAGYVQPASASYTMPDGNFVTQNSNELTSCFVVPAGASIGLENGAIIPGPPISVFDAVDNSNNITIDNAVVLPEFNQIYPKISQTYPEFSSLLNESINPPNLHYYGSRVWPTKGGDPNVHWGSGEQAYYMNFTFNGTTYNFTNSTFSLPSSYYPSYCYVNVSYSDADLKRIEKCIPSTYYVWGLSSLLVKINLGLLAVWTLGTFVVWADANYYSELCRNGRKLRGPYRAVDDLAEAMKEVLGDETCAYSNDDLSRALEKQPGLRYYTEHVKARDVVHIGISSIRRNAVKITGQKVYG